MLDKILIVSKQKVVIYYTHRPPVTVYSSSGNAWDLANELLAPLSNSNAESYTHWQRMKAVSKEDTQVIHLDDVA